MFIFLSAIVNLVFYSILKNKMTFRIFSIGVVLLFFGWLSSRVFQSIAPYTYEWLQAGIQDTINLIFYNQRTGNFGILLDNHTVFPEGWGLIFGEGIRLYGGGGVSRGFISSDIGYVNDLFMGGIVYITILYGTIFIFLSRKTYFFNKIRGDFLYSLITSQLIISLIIANYKGEVMRSGLVLIGVILIKQILLTENESEELENSG